MIDIAPRGIRIVAPAANDDIVGLALAEVVIDVHPDGGPIVREANVDGAGATTCGGVAGEPNAIVRIVGDRATAD